MDTSKFKRYPGSRAFWFLFGVGLGGMGLVTGLERGLTGETLIGIGLILLGIQGTSGSGAFRALAAVVLVLSLGSVLLGWENLAVVAVAILTLVLLFLGPSNQFVAETKAFNKVQRKNRKNLS